MRSIGILLFAISTPVLAQHTDWVVPTGPTHNGGVGRSGQPTDLPGTLQASGELNSIEWPTSLTFGIGAFGRVVIGDLTGDGNAEATVLHGGVVVTMYQPALFTGFFSISEIVTDIAFVPPITGSGPGSLLTVGPQGLFRWKITGGTGHPGLLDPIHGSSVTGNDWSNARLVRVAQTATGQTQVVGLGASGQQVLVSVAQGTGSFIQGPTSSLASPALDLELVQWDLDPDYEIAVLTASALLILKSDGTPLASFPAPGRTGHLAAMRQSGSSFDRLAWVGTSGLGANDEVLTIVDPTGVEPAVRLGAVGVVGLEAGDLDADGFDDLLIGHRSSATLLQLWNQGQQPSFVFDVTDATLAQELALDAPESSEPGWPGVAPGFGDLDGDDRPDIVAPLPGSEKIQLFRSADIQLAQDGSLPPFASVEYDQYAEFGELRVVPNLHPVEGATHLEAVLWRRNQMGHALGGVAVFHCRRALGDKANEVSIPVPEVTTPFKAVYYLEVRTVAMGPNDQVRDAGEWVAGGLAMNPLTFPYLLTMPGASDVFLLNADGIFGGTVLGGFVANEGRIEFFEDHVIPQTLNATVCQ